MIPSSQTRILGLVAALVAGCSSGGGGGPGGTGKSVSGQLRPFAPGGASVGSARPPAWAGTAASRLLAGRHAAGRLGATTDPLDSDGGMVAGQLVLSLREDGAGEIERINQAGRLPGLRMVPGAWASPSIVAVDLVDPADPTRPVGHDETMRARDLLGSHPAIRHAEPNYRRFALKVPDDPLYEVQWHYPQLNLPAAWDVTTGDRNVTVAIVDDGASGHPELLPRLLPGYDMISDARIAGDGDGRDNDPSEVPGTNAGRSVWHGTHVAGTIGAVSDNGQGVAGVDWSCRMVPVRALGIGGGTSIDILAAMNWAAGMAVPGVPNNPNPAVVINMSIGGGGVSQVEQDVINEVVGAGVTLVVAAGNDNQDAGGQSFGGYDNVIVVGALDYAGQRAPYSNFGTVVDVAAPGGNAEADLNADGKPDGVLSTYLDQAGQTATFEFLQGTSMATPHVTGVVALMKAVAPDLTPAQVESILKSTANPAARCQEGCGAGLVNAAAAVLKAKGGVGPGQPAKLALAADRLNIATGARGQIGLFNAGGGTLTWSASVDGAAASAIQIQGAASGSLAGGGGSSITLGVDRTGLGNGTYQASLLVTSNGGQARAALIFTVGAEQTPDLGAVVVGLIDVDTSGTVKEIGEATTTSGAGYRYTVTGDPGSWYVVALADRNNNGKLDAGDYWGFYRSLDNLERVTTTTGSVSSIDFALIPYQGGGEVTPVPCAAYRTCIEGCNGDTTCEDACTLDTDCSTCIQQTVFPCNTRNACNAATACLCQHCSAELDACLGPLSCG